MDGTDAECGIEEQKNRAANPVGVSTGAQRGAELLKPFKPGLGKKSLWLIRLGQKMYQDFVKSAVFIFTKTLHAFFYQ